MVLHNFDVQLLLIKLVFFTEKFG